MAAACSELLEVVVSDRRRIARSICRKHDLRTIHDAGKLLLKLAQDGETAEALWLIVAGAPVEWQSKHGRTALHQASFRGNVELTSALIGVGAQLDVQDVSGDTALMHATMRNHTSIALALIDAGAQLDLKDHAGNRALPCATTLGHVEIASALIDAHAQQDLWDGSSNMHLDHVEHAYMHLWCTHMR